MSVISGLVFVPMRMIPPGHGLVMRVIVMAFIVPVAMLMGHCRMSVAVRVLLAEENHERDQHNRASQRLNAGEPPIVDASRTGRKYYFRIQVGGVIPPVFKVQLNA